MVYPFVWWCVGVLTLVTTAQTACAINGTCTSGWVHFCSSCYRFQTQPVNQSTARKNCETEGGYLAFIENETEDQFISTGTTNESWIGLTTNMTGDDRGCNGSYTCNRLGWMWIDGESVVHENWLNGEPTGDSPCVRTKFGGWADLDCGQSKHYVCEKMVLPSTSTTSTTATTIYTSTDTTATSTDTATTSTVTTTTSTTISSTTTRIATTATLASSSSTPTVIPISSTIIPHDPTSIKNSNIPAVEDDNSDREKTIYVVVAGVVAAVLIPVLAIVVIYIRRNRKSRPRPHQVNIDHKDQQIQSDNDRLDGHTQADLTRESKPAMIMGSGLDWDQLPEPAASSTGSRDVNTGKETRSATYEYTTHEHDEFPDPTYSVAGKSANTLTSDITLETANDQDQHIYAKPIKKPSATPVIWGVVENDLYGT